jgi:hypothetical protein
MRFRAYLPALLLAAAAAAAPCGLAAQAVPVGEPFTICEHEPSSPTPGSYFCNEPDAAALTDGRFAVTWSLTFQDSNYPHLEHSWTSNRLKVIAPPGNVVAGTELALGHWLGDYAPYEPVIAPAGATGYVAVWTAGLYDRSEILVKLFGPGDAPLTEDAFCAGESREGLFSWSPNVAGNARGQFVLAWEDHEGPWADQEVTAISAQAFGADGRPASPLISIAREEEVDFEEPVVGIDPIGRFVVLWRERSRETGAVVLRGQRFDEAGGPLGPGFTVPVDGTPSVLPDGGFVVAWKKPEASTLRLRRFTRDGQPAGPIAVVPWTPTAVVLDLATDSFGNAALLAHDPTGRETRVHLFNRDLVRQGQPIRAPGASVLALSDAGRLLTFSGVNAQLWRVLHDDDACVRRGNLFLCDTAGDGFGAEATIPLGTGREPAMMADWDGDGRDDPCIYRRGRFLCKTDHQGQVLEFSPRIGQPGDQPFLGDLTGDGRADPCVRRGSVLLCDWRRLGRPTLRIDFGLPGDTFLLGDPDGDGRDEPCVFRDGRFLCDTAHDGGAAEIELDMITTWTSLGGTPLLGDVNGDGRDEACLWNAGWLECGVFLGGSRMPVDRIVRRFGLPGDVPLLGDLDAF